MDTSRKNQEKWKGFGPSIISVSKRLFIILVRNYLLIYYWDPCRKKTKTKWALIHSDLGSAAHFTYFGISKLQFEGLTGWAARELWEEFIECVWEFMPKQLQPARRPIEQIISVTQSPHAAVTLANINIAFHFGPMVEHREVTQPGWTHAVYLLSTWIEVCATKQMFGFSVC